jgi:hypothetical protein
MAETATREPCQRVRLGCRIADGGCGVRHMTREITLSTRSTGAKRNPLDTNKHSIEFAILYRRKTLRNSLVDEFVSAIGLRRDDVEARVW